MGTISRRKFIQGAGIGALGLVGAGSLSACSPSNDGNDTASDGSAVAAEGNTASWRTPPEEIPESDIVAVYDCDVLVIGLGHAGCCALRAAAESGVVAMGMHETPQESWTFQGFQMGHINSKYLASVGVPKVDLIEFFNDWQLRSNNRSNPGLIMNYAKNCGDTFDWLFDNISDEDYQTFSKAVRTCASFRV